MAFPTAQKPSSFSARSLLALLILSLVTSGWPIAAHAAMARPRVLTTYRTLENRGDRYEFRFERILNKHGETELTVILEEHRPLMPTLSVPVLYARDTDGDQRPDAWFIPTGPANLELEVRPAQLKDGWDVAQRLLIDVINVKNRNPFGVMLQAIQENLTFNGGISYAYFRELQIREMDLFDLEARTDRLLRSTAPPPKGTPDSNPVAKRIRKQIRIEAMESYMLISKSWGELDHQISSEGVRNHIIATFGDMALVGVAAGIVKGVGFLARVIGAKLGATVIGESAVRLYTQLATKISSTSTRVSSKLRLPVLSGAANLASQKIVLALAKLSLREQVAAKIESMEAKGALSRIGARGLILGGHAIKGVIKQAGYIVQTQLIQVVAEMMNRPDVKLDPNPIILAKNVFSNHDLALDVGYMTAETIMQTGVHKGLEHDLSAKQRLALCGVLSFVDSTGMSFMVKHESDKGRITMDTTWEMTIGNTQTFLDQGIGTWSAELAARSGNPKLKLLGLAFAFVDQTLGYVAYSKVSQWYEKDPNNWIKHAFEGSSSKSKNKDAIDSRLSKNSSSKDDPSPGFVMIPILGQRG